VYGGLALETDDARQVCLDVLVVQDGKAHVVVEEKFLCPALLDSRLESHRKSALVRLDRHAILLAHLHLQFEEKDLESRV